MKRRKQKRLIVLAEDANTSQLAEGFIQHYAVNEHRCRIHKYAKGWKDAAGVASALHLDRNAEDYVVLVVDFDRDDPSAEIEQGVARRISMIKKLVAGNVHPDRLFILGARSETESFKVAMHKYFKNGSLTYEGIGEALAEECADHQKRVGAWGDDELVHNMDEIQKLEQTVKPFLFK